MVNSMKMLNKGFFACSLFIVSCMSFAQDVGVSAEPKIIDANGFIDTTEAQRRNSEISNKRFEEESLKIDLSIATMKSEIAKLQSGSEGDKERPDGSSNTLSANKEIEALKNQVAALSEQKSNVTTASKAAELQVTKIVGFGGDLYATIYYKGSFYKKRAGDQISSGVVVKSINAESVQVSVNGRVKSYFVTSLELPGNPIGDMGGGMIGAMPIMGSAIPLQQN